MNPLSAPLVLDDSSDSTPLTVAPLIALCTYQEAQNIRAMVDGLREAFPDAILLVVDDNSPDGTAGLVRRMQAGDDNLQLIVRHDERGLGSAIVRAMKHAVANGHRYFLNLDADQSHDPRQLPKLLQTAESDPELDVVIGSRYVDGGKIVGWPLRRRIMSKMVNRFATGFLNLPVKDCSGSMRCYRTQALQELELDSLQCTGYAVLEELLVKINRSGGKMAEVPITFTERELGHSKLTLKEAYRSVRFMMRLAVELRRRA
ncbi:polyprenol monophosphomannose synthase [Stieleria sp. TO1_6]|uniref:polyprenol monophosphomannose synthase n=1 Tax=Stieleria tagensis TaxID=2956795 RepID=UPI00209B5D87|nr:polyprenol monophosphomannose synthase [Stieleria tagensis]MCO8123022.1 polyprenol monophosphomannose synthase [Stieleria tagensis]